MFRKINVILWTMFLCLGALVPAVASTLGFTGNPATDHWVLQGNSLTLGTYIRGSGSMNFDVFSGAFYLEAGSPLAGGQWQVGDLILGLGLVSQGAHGDDYYHDPRMVAKFGAADATFSPSTTLTPPGNGNGSFSGGNAGIGGVQVDYEYQLTNGNWGNKGNQSGVILTAAHVIYNSNTNISTDFGRVLGFFQEDSPGHFIPQSFEVVLDLSYLSRQGYSPLPSLHGKADLAWQMDSSYYTDAYVPDVGANVPLPGTLLLLGSGLAGLVLLRRQLLG